MNNIKVNKIKWTEIENLINDYFEELGYINDNFHNFIMFDGEPYTINLENEVIGFFSVGNSWDNGKMFRSFYIIPLKRRVSIEVFNKLIKDFNIEAALVASNDSHFISLSFEKMNELKGSFDMQAFNFIYGEPSRKAEYDIDCITEITGEECEKMISLTGDQWEGCLEDKNFKFYALKSNNKILGYGSIAKMKHNNKNVDVGNYTLPEYRIKGVGRSLIINLCKIAINQGYAPVAECWHGNKESVLTLTSSGLIPENRIFYVRFY